MNKVSLVILMFSFFVPSRLTHAQKYPDLASTPPMGWNSFDAFDCRMNGDQFRKPVDFMAENLL